MEITTQLSVFLENRAGVLARLADDLARHQVSIRALTVANLVDHSVVRLVVSDPQRALHLLGERGVLAFTSDVLAVEVPDGSRTIADLARRLGRAGINIDYAYGSGPAVYVHVSDLKKARAALAPTRRPRPRRR
jgi:hypothetical protein